MGWSERAVDNLLRIYGHKDVAALEEIDALYAADECDANVTHELPDRPAPKGLGPIASGHRAATGLVWAP